MTEHECVTADSSTWGQSLPTTSLGPVDPSWLAKLSGHLGIHPAKTIAPLLMAIWPGTSVPAVCCREACAFLMQADTASVPCSIVESNIRQAFLRRGMQVGPSTNLRAIIETDSHFIVDSSGPESDPLIRLDKASMPAPAVASLYLNGNGAGMLTAERALYQAAMHLTWPRALTDDDDYLCCQISELLLSEVDIPGVERSLPRHAMHLTEVGGALRQRSDVDARLALIFPKGQVAKARRPRLSEFLGKEELKPLFRVQESRLRQSEKVVTLRTDVLLRSLGPMAGLLQKALSSVVSPPSGTDSFTADQAWSGSDCNPPTQALRTPFHNNGCADGQNGSSGGENIHVNANTMPSASLPEHLDGCTTPPSVDARSGPDSKFTHAQSLFMGLHSAPEVPAQIRNCWATSSPDKDPNTRSHAIAIPTQPSPSTLYSALSPKSSGLVRESPGLTAPQLTSTREASGLISFTSEDISEVTAHGPVGASWRGAADFGSGLLGHHGRALSSYLSGSSRNIMGNGNGGEGGQQSNSDVLMHAQSNLESGYGSVWGNRSMWSGHPSGGNNSMPLKMPSGPISEFSHGNVWGSLTLPTAPNTPGSAVSSFSTRPVGSAPASNYAAVLRAPNAPSSANTSRTLQNNPEHSETPTLSRTDLVQNFDAVSREVYDLLWSPWTEQVLDSVLKFSGKFVRDGRLVRSDLNQEFQSAVNHCVMSKPQLAGLLDKAGASTKKQVMLAGGLSLSNTNLGLSNGNGNTVASLKPLVRKEILALLDQHHGTVRLEHFDSGVVCHLQRRSESAAVDALREIGRRGDFATANNKPAYITHWLMKLAAEDSQQAATAVPQGKSAPSASILSKSTSQKPDMRRLPRAVQHSVENLVDSSPWIDWRHFDAGVMKVLQQLAVSTEPDALAEIRQVEVSELSSVKNMPAYLNKCFNNRLWKVRY